MLLYHLDQHPPDEVGPYLERNMLDLGLTQKAYVLVPMIMGPPRQQERQLATHRA
jgi:hypothetical protein